MLDADTLKALGAGGAVLILAGLLFVVLKFNYEMIKDERANSQKREERTLESSMRSSIAMEGLHDALDRLRESQIEHERLHQKELEMFISTIRNIKR